MDTTTTSDRDKPTAEFNKERHPVSDKQSMHVEGAPNGGKQISMVDERSQFRNPSNIQMVERGQAGLSKIADMPMGTEFKHGSILVKSGGVDEGGMGFNNQSMTDGELRDRMARLLPHVFPPELQGLLWRLTGQQVDEGMVATICGSYPNIGASWGTGGALSVNGTPALYKGVFLRGWSKASNAASWVAMTVAQEVTNPPYGLESDYVDGTNAYPWHALRPTWDYPRAHS